MRTALEECSFRVCGSICWGRCGKHRRRSWCEPMVSMTSVPRRMDNRLAVPGLVRIAANAAQSRLDASTGESAARMIGTASRGLQEPQRASLLPPKRGRKPGRPTAAALARPEGDLAARLRRLPFHDLLHPWLKVADW